MLELKCQQLTLLAAILGTFGRFSIIILLVQEPMVSLISFLQLQIPSVPSSFLIHGLSRTVPDRRKVTGGCRLPNIQNRIDRCSPLATADRGSIALAAVTIWQSAVGQCVRLHLLEFASVRLRW